MDYDVIFFIPTSGNQLEFLMQKGLSVAYFIVDRVKKNFYEKVQFKFESDLQVKMNILQNVFTCIENRESIVEGEEQQQLKVC